MEKLKTVYICQQCGKKAEMVWGNARTVRPGTVFSGAGVTETKASTASDKNTTPPKELSQLAFEAFERFPGPSANSTVYWAAGLYRGL